MALQALLSEVDPGWYAAGTAEPPRELLARARDSALGRRMLAAWLAADAAPALFAPRAGDAGPVATLPQRWERTRLVALLRDAGVLAYAPAIRAEVSRDSVKRLRAALGNSYLLALDRGVWDGKVEPAQLAVLSTALREALATGDEVALHWLFERQGRAELRHWAMRRDPPLADWIALTHPRETHADPHLPEKPLLRVYTHHESRAAGG